MDERDHRILDELKADAWLSYAELARRVHLSASAVQRRVERLLAAGVLRGAHARVADGRETLIYVLVELRDDARATVRGFTKSMRASKLVESAHYVAGEADVVLALRVAGLPEYARFFEERVNGDARPPRQDVFQPASAHLILLRVTDPPRQHSPGHTATTSCDAVCRFRGRNRLN